MQLREVGHRSAKALLLLASLCFGLLAYAFWAVAQSGGGQNGRQPLSLSIAGPSGVIAPGGACDVSITLANVSDKPLTLPVTNGEGGWGAHRDLKVTVVSSPSGRILKPIPFDLRKAILSQHSSSRSKTLQPGESISGIIHVSEFFDLSSPGIYQVQITRDIPKELGTGVVTSNTVEITVAK